MFISNQDRDALYKHITDLLTETPRGLSPHHDLTNAIQFILQVAQDAIADSAERWNQSSQSITQRLPVELLAECLAWLEPDDRVLVTRVSRRWRAIALGEPTLWTRLRVRKRKNRFPSPLEVATRLASLLKRSCSLPLDIYLSVDTHADVVTEPLAADLWRIRALQCRGDVFHTFSRASAMPVLESLSLFTGTRLPDSERVPNLRTLAVRGFVIASTSVPFAHLTRFKGTAYPVARSFNVFSLFALFPRLVSLHLVSVSRKCIPYLPSTPTIPPTLEELVLEGTDEMPNFAPYLVVWRGHKLRRLVLARHGTHLAAVLDLFCSIHSGASTMRMSSASWLLVIAGDKLTVESHLQHGVVSWAAINPQHLVRVTELELTAYAFLDLASTSIPLASLRSLSLHSFSGVSPRCGGSLHVPQLRMLYLRTSDRDEHAALEFCTRRLPDVLRDCLRLDGAKMMHIRFSDARMENVDRFDFEPLSRFAAELYVGDQIVRCEEEATGE